MVLLRLLRLATTLLCLSTLCWAAPHDLSTSDHYGVAWNSMLLAAGTTEAPHYRAEHMRIGVPVLFGAPASAHYAAQPVLAAPPPERRNATQGSWTLYQ